MQQVVLVTDDERFSGVGIFIGHSSSLEFPVLCFTLNYTFITEALVEGKVKYVSFVKEYPQSYLDYYLNKLRPRESH